MTQVRGSPSLHPLVVFGLVVALFVLALYSHREVLKPVAYWIIDARTLGVVVAEGISIECEVARVDEASDSVRIWAQCLEPLLPVPMAAALTFNVFQVDLQAPLANRSVLDGSGNAGTLCQKPAPDCTPPL
jgi:hypothetical protein